MDPDRAANLLDRLKRLQIDGDNLVSGAFVGSPEPFRLSYLGWRERCEQLFHETGVALETLNSLQTSRHRDIVKGEVPANQLYREIAAEVALVWRVLDANRAEVEEYLDGDQDEWNAFLSFGPSAAIAPVPDTWRSFSSDAGRQYAYDPDDQLGQSGGYGRVFRGRDESGAEVAVKRVPIRIDSTRRRMEDARLAQREVDVAKQVRGPHLLPLLDVTHGADELLLVMPVAQPSLADAIAASGGLPAEEVRRMLLDVVAGMQELANAGVLHRDIKPANIMQYMGNWCLADFGIARFLDAATATMTWAGTGTREYWAPELWRNERQTVAADLYALGCVALEAITGRPAFGGDDLREAHLTAVPQVPEGLDPALRRVILALLHKNPAARPVDARKVAELLAPTQGLSDAQLAVQRFRARVEQRDLERGGQEAEAVQHVGRQSEVRAAFPTFWQEFVDYVKTADPDVKALYDDPSFSIDLAGAQLSIRLGDSNHYLGRPNTDLARGGPAASGLGFDRLLLVAEVYIASTAVTRLLANLVAVDRNDLLHWEIVQLLLDSSDERPHGLKCEEFEHIWNQSGLREAPKALTRPADPEAMLSLFMAELEAGTPDAARLTEEQGSRAFDRSK